MKLITLFYIILCASSIVTSSSALRNPKDRKDKDLTSDHECFLLDFAYDSCDKIGKVNTAALLRAFWDGINVPELTKDSGINIIKDKYTWKRINTILQVRIGLDYEVGDVNKFITTDADLFKENYAYITGLKNAASPRTFAEYFSAAKDGLDKAGQAISGNIAKVDFVAVGLGTASSIAKAIILLYAQHRLVDGVVKRNKEFNKNSLKVVDNVKCRGKSNRKMECSTKKLKK